MRPHGWTALACALALLGAACGQLPGTHRQVTAQSDFGLTAAQTSPGDQPAAGAGPAGEAAPAGGAVPAAGGRLAAATGPGDRTGIFPDRIVIGIHAPITGAAPITADAFEKGKDLYWRWLKRKGEQVLGRDIEVVFRDDTYSPSVASQRCQEMAERDKAFLLVGAAGTDQIAACANFAAKRRIPYLSSGVTEQGLTGYRTYFAVSASYKAQGPILAQLLLRKFGTQALDRVSPGGLAAADGRLQIAFVRADTANFDDAEAGFKQGLQQTGFDMSGYSVYKLPKEDSPTLRGAVTSAIQDMSQKGVDVVVTLIAPVVVIEFVQQADSRGYRPRYTAPGVSTVNAVSNVLCQSAPQSYDKSTVFFPWPGWPEVMKGRFDPEFAQAIKELAPDLNDIGKGDIALSLWSASKILHQMFLQAGPDLSRQSLVTTLERGQPIRTGLYPDLTYTASTGGHWGTKAVHRLEVECADRAFHQREGPVTGY